MGLGKAVIVAAVCVCVFPSWKGKDCVYRVYDGIDTFRCIYHTDLYVVFNLKDLMTRQKKKLREELRTSLKGTTGNAKDGCFAVAGIRVFRLS